MRLFPLAGALCVLVVSSVHCQWYLGVDITRSHYGGSSRDTSSGGIGTSVRPGDATAVGLRLTRRFRAVDATLRLSYAKTGLAAAGSGVVVTDKTVGDLIEAATLVAVQVRRVGPSGAVRAELGPALHLWNMEEMRARIGALGAMAYEWTVAGRWSGAIRVEGAVSPSWFENNEPPAEFARQLTWRYGVTLGVVYLL